VIRVVAKADARAALESWVARAGRLTDAAASHAEAEALRGRGRVHVVPTPPGPWPGGARWVVRHYHRGGALGSVLRDVYVRGRVPRPIREYRLIRALEEIGIPTAPAVGAAVYGSGPFYRGDLVTEWVPASRDLAEVLFGAAQLDEVGRPGQGDVAGGRSRSVGGDEAGAAMEAAGGLVRLLHEHGVVHPDLNIKNILIAPGTDGPRALVIDLDRARIARGGVSDRARRRMLGRFGRSLRKWEKRAGVAPRPEWLAAFDRGYGTTRPPR
jgi:3-deoxy-D-manno-octulosonic acid kinase